MRKRLPRSLAALATSFALAAGALQLTTVPAHAASFRVSMKASDARVAVCEGINLVGKVSPKPSSRTIHIQQKLVGSSKWETVAKISTTGQGNYRTTVIPTQAGSRHYRVHKPKAGKRKAGYSPSVKVSVTSQTGDVALCAASSRLSGGGTIAVTGTGLTGTSGVSFTPQLSSHPGIPPVRAAFVVLNDLTLKVTVPAGLGGAALLKVTTPSGVLTAGFKYKRTWRSATSFENQILSEINKRRAKKQVCNGKSMPKVGRLSWDGELADLALAHSRDLAARQSLYGGLDHVTHGTDSFADRFHAAGFSAPFGEILALSPKSRTAKQVVAQWMGSPSHCKSIMRKSWKKAGVGVAAGSWRGPNGPQASIFSNVDFQ